MSGMWNQAKGTVMGENPEEDKTVSKTSPVEAGKAAGGAIAGLNPFKAPSLKDVPDPTGPANVREPVMAPGGPAIVRGPGTFQGASIGGVKDPKAAMIDQSKQAEFRDFQGNLASQLAQQASGVGPSVSGNMLKQGQEANLAATMAQLNSQRGGANPAMARATMQTAAEIQGKAAQEAATARLQEQTAAQGLLSQVAGAGRQQDIGLATEQAQMQQQAALAKYQGDLQIAVQQGQIDQQTAMSMFDQANQNARQDAGLAAQFQQLQAQYASMGMDAQKANQMAALEIERMKQGAVQAQNANTLASDGANKALMGNILSAGATVGGAMVGGPAGAAVAGTVVNQYGQTVQPAQPGDRNFVGPPAE